MLFDASHIKSLVKLVASSLALGCKSMLRTLFVRPAAAFLILFPVVLLYPHSASAICRGAYGQETREIILSLDKATKTAPNGKQILKNVGVGMYLGAKIGFLGQNGTDPTSMLSTDKLKRQVACLVDLCDFVVVTSFTPIR